MKNDIFTETLMLFKNYLLQKMQELNSNNQQQTTNNN